MNKELKDITITVCATQDTVESDSFNNQYDENATYPVVNVTELKEALTNDGYYYGGGTAVQVQEGTLVINGGTFACEPFDDPYGCNFLINCVDSAYKNGTAKIIIQGGTFLSTSTPPTTPLRVPHQLRDRWLQGRASDSDQRRHLVYCGC